MRWDSRQWLVLLIFSGMYLIPALFMLYFVLRTFRRGPRAAKLLFKELGAEGAGSTVDFLWEGKHEGVPFAGRYFFAKGTGTPTLSLRVLSHGSASFRILPKRKCNAFSLWLLGQVPTGQPELEDKVFLAGEDVDAAGKFFQTAEKRKLVLELLQAGVTEIDWRDGSVGVQWRRFSSHRREPVDYYRNVLRKLALLGHGVPAPAPQIRRLSWSRLIMERVPAVLLVVAAGLAIFTPGFVLDNTVLIRESLLLSLPGIALYLALAWQLGFGRRHFRRRLGTAALSAIVAFPITGALAARYFNNVLDGNEHRFHRARVVAKSAKILRSGSFRGGCYVWVESWRKPGTSERFSVDAAHCRVVEAGKTAFSIETRAGRLGFEWIVAAPLEKEIAALPNANGETRQTPR